MPTFARRVGGCRDMARTLSGDKPGGGLMTTFARRTSRCLDVARVLLGDEREVA